MAVVTTLLVGLLGIVGAALLAALLMPLSLRASGAFAPWHATGQIDMRWAWGLLGVRLTRERGAQLRLLGRAVYRFEAGGAKEEKKKRRGRDRKKARKRGVRWAWTNRPLFYRLARALRLRGTLRGTIGLGDPADTAELAILLGPALERLPGFETRLAWNYVDEVLFLDGAIRARVWPVELVSIVLATLARGESRRALLAKP